MRFMPMAMVEPVLSYIRRVSPISNKESPNIEIVLAHHKRRKEPLLKTLVFTDKLSL
jgi:hypothetical protein